MDSHIASIFSFSFFTFVFGMLIFPYCIALFQYIGLGKQIRTEAMIGKAIEFFHLHKEKSGTPVMGGLVILLIVSVMVGVSMIFQYLGIITYSLFNQKETYLSLFTLYTIGLLGAIDDYMNVKGIGEKKGLSARLKMLGLLIFAFLGSLWFYYKLGWNAVDETGRYIRTLNIPFLSEGIELGIFFIPLFIFVIVACANSVNITDGLDGLAGGLLLFSYGVYAYITYSQGLYLLSTLCVTIIAALLSFLWYNVKPAKIYLGDVGSLALGANLGIMAMITNTLFVLVIVGIIYIVETLSVIIQLTSKKFRHGKKVFRIAPFHHHLEAIGWKEETIVFRFWLLGLVFAAISIIVYHL